jgi:glycosyltransferase involved in cell wall biosynthesis
MTISIIIPVYNEKDYIKPLLSNIDKKIKSEKKVYFIYDSLEDNSIEEIINQKKHFNFEILLLKNKYGQGAAKALKTGFEFADTYYTLPVMADLCDDINVVDKMKMLIDSGFHCVGGSRYIKGGKHKGGPFFKKFLSKYGSKILFLTKKSPICDCSNSFKMYQSSRLKALNIESSQGFEINLEILYKLIKEKSSITEIPYTWKDRKIGKSRFKLARWLPLYIKWYLKILF